MYDENIPLNGPLSPSKFGSRWVNASTRGQRTTAPQPGDDVRLQRKSQRSLHRIRFPLAAAHALNTIRLHDELHWKWISLNSKLLHMLWTQLDSIMNFIENEFHWIREMRSLRTMCVKVITMTLRTLLLRLAAGALRGTRTYPNTFDSARTPKRLTQKKI